MAVADPLAQVPWPLTTPRLSIRRVTLTDADATWAYRRLPEVGRWIGWFTTDQAEYRERFATPVRQATVLVVQCGSTLIGDIVVHVEDAPAQREAAPRAAGRQVEVGWSFDPAHGGRGYATEAVAAVVDACFGVLGAHRVHAICYADNEPSWRLMERLGMRREARHVRAALHRSGAWLDQLDYAILADEWPGLDAALRRARP